MKIYWVKQKLIGILMLLASLIFMVFLVHTEAAISVLIFVPLGLYYLFAKDRLFKSDYILEINYGKGKRL